MNNYKFSLIHRLLHWSMALTIIFILITIFLRLGWMNKNIMATIIFNNLQENNIKITQKEAVSIAKNIRGNMFNWHVYIGYVLLGLYLLRITYIIIKKGKFRTSSLIKYSLKKKFQSLVYLIFYIGLGITLITGLLIQNAPKEYAQSLKSIHQLSLYFMLIFLVFHMIGIFIGEKSTDKGIVSAMINGGDNISR
ncbi:cytochrome b/b6 domain-containing protein [Apibacter muscae]|uniref:Cytochrome b/b6 domain-containing protein n=1 Tax=Apibacter muscae TaxID=2509004 RepID=A0A563DG37_9FLAO|nr:cytochrome b/b6 domain-containing protein [Apibacter muscae]TWP23756.1 cytochrome b/b6 domain-containing protein [Apibacter muscae]TWP29042.1 cytochrome b/b6 domain-containing protein [Apibacter muscae]TWP30377.1 cytochrome b/b6 domain-containing protein [Apibacter muscae]